MLRDVVIHIQNEQPIMADLLSEPAPSDVALICSNLRTMAGKKPVFVDMTDSTFVIPLAQVRFLEIRKSSMAAMAAEKDEQAALAGPARLNDGGSGEDHAAALAAESGIQAVRAAMSGPSSDEIDPELLRRIREA